MHNLIYCPSLFYLQNKLLKINMFYILVHEMIVKHPTIKFCLSPKEWFKKKIRQLIHNKKCEFMFFSFLCNDFVHPFYLKQVLSKRTHQYSTDSQVDIKHQPIKVFFSLIYWGPLQWKKNPSKAWTGTSDFKYYLKSWYSGLDKFSNTMNCTIHIHLALSWRAFERNAEVKSNFWRRDLKWMKENGCASL